MAILEGIEVCLEVDGVALKEYHSDPVEAEPCNDLLAKLNAKHTHHCYVEVVAGTCFTIALALLPDFALKEADGADFDVYLDGEPSQGTAIEKLQHQATATVTEKIRGHWYGKDSEWYEKQFQFSRLDLVEDGKFDEVKSLVIGSVRVDVWRARLRTVSHDPVPDSRDDAEPISEKTAKGQAVYCGIKTGSPVKIDPISCGFSVHQLSNVPLASFVFKYRSREALMELGVIERPIPLENRDLDSLNGAEKSQLIKQYKAREEADKVKIKVENQEQNLRKVASRKRTHAALKTDDGEGDSDIEEIPMPKIFKREIEFVDEIL